MLASSEILKRNSAQSSFEGWRGMGRVWGPCWLILLLRFSCSWGSELTPEPRGLLTNKINLEKEFWHPVCHFFLFKYLLKKLNYLNLFLAFPGIYKTYSNYFDLPPLSALPPTPTLTSKSLSHICLFILRPAVCNPGLFVWPFFSAIEAGWRLEFSKQYFCASISYKSRF